MQSERNSKNTNNSTAANEQSQCGSDSHITLFQLFSISTHLKILYWVFYIELGELSQLYKTAIEWFSLFLAHV
jgi:hypothetical protein